MDSFPKILEPIVRATPAITPHSDDSVDMPHPLTPHDPCSTIPEASAKLPEDIPEGTPSSEPNQKTAVKQSPHEPILWQLVVMNQPDAPLSQPSALANAHVIRDLDKITYPKWIKTPDAELNEYAMQSGKFKYDRDFLLQFMEVCKERPDRLIPLESGSIRRREIAPEVFGEGQGTKAGKRKSKGLLGPLGSAGRYRLAAPGEAPDTPSESMGAGYGVGNFQVSTFGPFRSSRDPLIRLPNTFIPSGAAAEDCAMTHDVYAGGVDGIHSGAMNGAEGGEPLEAGGRKLRVRSQRGRGKVKDDTLEPNQQPEPSGHTFLQDQAHQQKLDRRRHWENLTLGPVEPLQPSENRWIPTSRTGSSTTKLDGKVLVDRKITSLLNKLTTKMFDSISDQIINWANESDHETDGRTLNQVIKLVLDKAIDESRWNEMYAKLCEKMMEQISPNVSDEGLRNHEGKPMSGRQLFRRYLLDLCQVEFERSWSTMEAALASAASKKEEDDAKASNAAMVARAGYQQEEVPLYSEEYYTALRAKRRNFGLITFIGEMFKLYVIPERIVHECVKKLLTEIELLREEHEIKSLCTLLAMVGEVLDTQKNKDQMNRYFNRMDAVANKLRTGSRMQYALLDVIDSRHRNWMTIRAFNAQAASERATAPTHGKVPTTMGGTRRGEHIRGGSGGIGGISPEGKPLNPDPAAARAPPVKTDDLSQSGQTANSGDMKTVGPSSVSKKGQRAKAAEPGAGGSRGKGAQTTGPTTGEQAVGTGSNSPRENAGSSPPAAQKSSSPRVTKAKREPARPKSGAPVTLSASSTTGPNGAQSNVPKRKMQLLPKNPPIPKPPLSPATTAGQAKVQKIAAEKRSRKKKTPLASDDRVVEIE
ncbi:hypothetical protein FRB93_014039 [Tulasnella sp. JGI-2019a]|nr:hypothetical protein FRB93_014039 [Tulasnella sp. JGI-2019a]